MKCFSISDIGLVRKNNEDSILISEEAGLFALADGMGGHNAGEVASYIAVDSLKKFDIEENIDSPEKFQVAFEVSNENIYKLSLANSDQYGMGTTLSAIKIIGNYLYYAHIGDSRIYCFSPFFVNQLTEDHSRVWELYRNGKLGREDCRFHPNKNIITRALGQDAEIIIDKGIVRMERDFFILICSDGLTDMLSDDELKNHILINSKNPEKILPTMVGSAKQNGGHDNISAILINFEKKDEAPS